MRMLLFSAFVLFIFTLPSANTQSNQPEVLSKSGTIRGIRLEVLEKDVEAFLGIPYAEPPIGDRRFKRPVPIKPWQDPYEATSRSRPCFQNTTKVLPWVPKLDSMSEDCLYLNVWVPGSTRDTQLKPVMVWIHGGGFNSGSSSHNLYDGSILAAYGDVVVASMNYRVGVFGFFSADIDDAPGNMGMYDQALALKWISDNIESFSGDPTQITLFGQSAGAISVGLHMISPVTRGLFKRAIVESGSPFHPLAGDDPKVGLMNSNRVAEFAGCADDFVNLMSRPQDVVRCLKRLKPQALANAEGLVLEVVPISFIPRWGDDFMPRNPVEALREGDFKDTELLVGDTKDEGSFFVTYIMPEIFGPFGEKKTERLRKEVAIFLISALFGFTNHPDTRSIANLYLNSSNNNDSDSIKKGMSDAFGDYFLLCPTVFFAEANAQRGNEVYFYLFTHRPSNTQWAEWMGVAHFEEVPFVFGEPIRDTVNYTVDESTFSREILDKWITFAKTGKPFSENQSWPLYSRESPQYLELNPAGSVTGNGPHENCNFWRSWFGTREN